MDAVVLELDLLSTPRGSVTAPAGCGKTQLISDTLKTHAPSKPVLVLTHTNAGATALRARLQRDGVSKSTYTVATIDGWSRRLIMSFPLRGGHDPAILELRKPATDYPAIRMAAWRLLSEGHISDALAATYSSMLVDEYQDCSTVQHGIIAWAANVLPTCVLGDHLQAIFGFGGKNPLVDWQRDVVTQFPPLGTLKTPWRWRNAGTENFGQWLLTIRSDLEAGRGVDLRTAPAELRWVELGPSADTQRQQRLAAAGTKAAHRDHRVLVIGDSKNPRGQRLLASQTPGATAVETAELSDLTEFGRSFTPAASDALEHLLRFAGELMNGVGAPDMLKRVQTLLAGRAQKQASPSEAAAVAFLQAPSHARAHALLSEISERTGTRIYRPELLRNCLTALQAAGGSCTFHEATVRERERARHVGRPLSRRAVGSTLLVKGLEADVAVLLHPELMDARHLYVALTRGSRQLVVCSRTPVITPLPTR